MAHRKFEKKQKQKVSSFVERSSEIREIRENPRPNTPIRICYIDPVVSTEFTRRGPTSRSGYRDPLSARDFKENVGRLVVTVEEYLFRELRVAVLACARSNRFHERA
ncbi:hypothetical protein K0M31_007831 [Melipona bicolor]|uniref:Uncharacterized protein n=1 Tax=Melipona bicolor TaxID=60889 RepID=A0AA40KW05_9HYME|nr:hypothetical protein K0M31_007831 [Melipona bicolor]